MINLRDLRLDNARALLEHDPSQRLPEPDESPTAYLQSIVDHLCELSLKDPLTGLANRRHFRNVLAREIDVVARSGESALLLMLDIDHFKRYNDRYGHPQGDETLKAVVAALRASLARPHDLVARYGGEELVVVLPDTGMAGVTALAQRMVQAVQALALPHADSPVGPCVTMSAGVCSQVPHAGADGASGSAALIAHADAE